MGESIEDGDSHLDSERGFEVYRTERDGVNTTQSSFLSFYMTSIVEGSYRLARSGAF